MFRVARSDVDGVPVFWADHGVEHPIVMLTFRVGMVDERIQTRGLTHLVEHLALDIGRRPFEYNGSVLDSRTILWARGTPEQLTEFVSLVCANLSPDRFEDDLVAGHARVLRTEGASNRGGWIQELKAERFGARGAGLARWREFALHWVGAAEAAEWSGRFFTRGNVAVWMSTPPPTGLRFDLGEGQLQPVPPPEPLDLAYPMAFAWNNPEVAFTTLVRRRSADRAAWIALESAAQHELRHERALTYHVFESFEPIDAHTAHQSFSVDCLRETAGDVRDGILALIGRLRTTGPTAEEMGWVRHWLDQGFKEKNAPSWLDYVASVHLFGGPDDADVERIRAAHAALDGATVAEAFDASMQQAFMRSPEWIDPPTGWNRFPGWHDHPLTGRTFLPRDPEGSPAAEITVTEEGVTERWPNGDVATVRFADCAGIGWDPEGYRVLWAFDAGWVTIDPRLLVRGHEAAALVDRLASPDLYVPLDGAAPASRTPGPDDTGAPKDQPPPRPDEGATSGGGVGGRARQLVTRLIKRSGTNTTPPRPDPST